MSYTERLVVVIPPNILEIGRSITRALDVDVGGAESWTPVRDDSGSSIVSYVADTPCTPEFKAQAEVMLADPALLHQAVAADYAVRWTDLTPPTLNDCQLFCSSAVVSTSNI